ncbi:MAG: NAD-dependent epimerase/dehydratase family protein [Candidatus Brocadiales bacterium]
MNILITGSSGFIGSALAKRFSRDQIIGLDRVLYPGNHTCTYRYCVDIVNREGLFDALKDIRSRLGPRLDCVFHLAAHYDFSNKKDRLYEEINEKGTRNLLEALADFEVGAFIFTSSTAVMKGLKTDNSAMDLGGRLSESSPLGSLLEYGESKRRAEEVVISFKNQLKVFIVRLGGVYARECRLIPLAHQIASIYKRDISSRFLPGGGCGCISYIHIDDVLDGLERIVTLRSRMPSGSVYILSEEDYLSYAELYRLISQGLCGGKGGSRPVSLPSWLLRGGVRATNYLHYIGSGQEYFFKPWMINQSLLRYCFDAEKAKRELGWKTRHSLRSYVEDMLRELKADPERWFKANNIYL